MLAKPPTDAKPTSCWCTTFVSTVALPGPQRPQCQYLQNFTTIVFRARNVQPWGICLHADLVCSPVVLSSYLNFLDIYGFPKSLHNRRRDNHPVTGHYTSLRSSDHSEFRTIGVVTRPLSPIHSPLFSCMAMSQLQVSWNDLSCKYYLTVDHSGVL